jgi:hypothetical protein
MMSQILALLTPAKVLIVFLILFIVFFLPRWLRSSGRRRQYQIDSVPEGKTILHRVPLKDMTVPPGVSYSLWMAALLSSDRVICGYCDSPRDPNLNTCPKCGAGKDAILALEAR